MRRSMIAVLGALPILATPAAADPLWAGDRSQTARIAVTTAELQSPEGLAQVYDRVTAAAHSMCAELNADADDRAWCESDAVSNAIARPDMAALADYHEEHVRAEATHATLASR
jgi:UrcA family protein